MTAVAARSSEQASKRWRRRPLLVMTAYALIFGLAAWRFFRRE
jgi:hypothetical protein